MDPADQSVIIDLHGSKAVRGVELDGFQRWVDHFRRALRDFERSRSTRQEPVKRTGTPGRVSDISTAFRLVHFKRGSGIAKLEPIDVPASDEQLGVAQEPPALQNLKSLVEAVKAERVDSSVVDALEDARKAVGDDGHYGIRFAADPNGRTPIDRETVERLHAAASANEPEPEARPVSVIGLLHLIEVESPERVAIRDRDGRDWVCTFEPDLEQRVLSLVKSIVWAKGTGEHTSGKAGRMHLADIEVVPQHKQSALFTFERVPADELDARQGVSAPQGLAATVDPEWADDEQDRAYLALVLGDDAEP
jgi:hypothetical protein